MKLVKRPLSPHLQVYKPQLTSVLSITHRGTGVFLSLGALVLTYWLVSLAVSEELFNSFHLHTSFWYGKLFLIGFVFSFYYHLANGIRHLFWDIGLGLEISTTYKSGYFTIFISTVLTLATLFVGGGTMNIKLLTPLRILMSASEAVRHWWAQRLTALVLIPLSLWFVYSLTTMYNANYETVTLWLNNATNSLLMLFFILSLYYHAVLGLQVVIEDYVESDWQRKSLLLLIKIIFSIAALSAVIAIFLIYMEF